MKEIWTLEELRANHPTATEAELEGVLAMLNKPRGTILDAWRSESEYLGVPQDVGPDGLTRPERELNRFAEEHGLLQPFPLAPRNSGGDGSNSSS